MPLLMERELYIQAMKPKVTRKAMEDAGFDQDHTSVEEYLSDSYTQLNDKVHARLTIAVREHEQARNILAKHAAGRGQDKTNKFESQDPAICLLYGDGRKAWEELKQACLGGEGLDTADSILTRLFNLEHQQPNIRDYLSRHSSEVKKLLDIPDLTPDQIAKMNLLHGMRSMFPEYQVTEERCATDPTLGYHATATALLKAVTRMTGHEETACYSKTEPCWRCGQPGHQQKDCQVVLGDARDHRNQGGQSRGGSRARHGQGRDARNNSRTGQGQNFRNRNSRKNGGNKSSKFGRRNNVRGTKARLAAAEEALKAAGIELEPEDTEDQETSSERDEEEEFGFRAVASESPVTDSGFWPWASMLMMTAVFMVLCAAWYALTPQATTAVGILTNLPAGRFNLMTRWLCGDTQTQESARPARAGERITINVDTGCTRHMFGQLELFDQRTYRRIHGNVTLADNTTTRAIGEGTVRFKAVDSEGLMRVIKLENCWHVPSCGDNHLFSISQMRNVKSSESDQENKPGAMFAGALLLRFASSKVCPFREAHGSYFWDVWPLKSRAEQANRALSGDQSEADKDVRQGLPLAIRPPVAVDNKRHRAHVDRDVWHDRLGHISPLKIDKMGDTTVKGLLMIKSGEPGHKDNCITCLQANLKRTPRKIKGGIVTTHPLERVHVDGVSGFEVASFGKHQGYLFVDDFSRHKWFGGTRSKSNFLDVLKEYITFIKLKTHSVLEIVIGTIKSDWASELSAGKVKKWCDEQGIKLVHSSPGVHQENGVAERSIGVVKEVARAIHKGAWWPKEFWFLSMKAATHVMQFWPMTVHQGKSSYEILYGSKPDVSHLRTLGCLVFFHNWYDGKINFHTDRGLKGMHVGYVEQSRAYLIWRPDTQRLIKSSEVVFKEDIKPMQFRKAKHLMDRIKVPAITWGQAEDDTLHLLDNQTASLRLQDKSHDGAHAEHARMPRSYVDIEPLPQVTDVMQISPANPAISPENLEISPENLAISPEISENSDFGDDRPRRGAAQAAEQRIASGYKEHAFRGEAKSMDVSRFEAMYESLIANETDEIRQIESCVQESARSAVSGYYGYEPFSHRDAMTCTDADKWHAAEVKEIEGLERLGAFEYVDADEPKRLKQKVISCKWVYKIKPEKYKARLVIRGFMQEESGEAYAPTMRLVTFRLLLAIAALLSWTPLQQDVMNAFLNAVLETPVYMRCIEGYEREGKVIKLLKALYGLRESPRAWYDTLKDRLLEIGLVQTVMDPCMFVLIEANKIVLILGVHVDDCLCVGQEAKVKWFAGMMTRVFMMEDLGRPSRMLGIDIEWTNQGVVLRQTGYIDKILKRFGMDKCHGSPTPMTPGSRLLKSQQANEGDDKPDFEYRSCVACLIYLAICTRFELCFAVKELSTYLERPGKAMITQAKRALRYLQATKNHGIRYSNKLRSVPGSVIKSSWDSILSAWSDADWASQPEDRKSTEGCIIMFNGTALLWWSKTIKTICLSSTQAEYIAASDTCREVIFLRALLEALGFRCERATPYLCDNQGAIATAKGVNTTKSKHIECRYHFIRQCHEQGEVIDQWVRTQDQCADVMTKALNGPQHRELTVRASGFPELTRQPDEGFSMNDQTYAASRSARASHTHDDQPEILVERACRAVARDQRSTAARWVMSVIATLFAIAALIMMAASLVKSTFCHKKSSSDNKKSDVKVRKSAVSDRRSVKFQERQKKSNRKSIDVRKGTGAPEQPYNQARTRDFSVRRFVTVHTPEGPEMLPFSDETRLSTTKSGTDHSYSGNRRRNQSETGSARANFSASEEREHQDANHRNVILHAHSQTVHPGDRRSRDDTRSVRRDRPMACHRLERGGLPESPAHVRAAHLRMDQVEHRPGRDRLRGRRGTRLGPGGGRGPRSASHLRQGHRTPAPRAGSRLPLHEVGDRAPTLW